MFNTQFSKSNQWSQICQVKSLQVRPSPTSGYVIFSKTYMTHVLHPIFQEKSTGNGLRYVRGPQVGLVDIDVDEHDLEASDIPETIPNRPLLKNWILNMYYVFFCGTWPG